MFLGKLAIAVDLQQESIREEESSQESEEDQPSDSSSKLI
jgi:hypothetical protein